MTSHQINRRSILAGAAAVATPVPALASGLNAPDPIFAAIAARKATRAAEDAADENTPDSLVDALAEADAEALRVLSRTPPTTPAGAAALLRYLIECKEAGDYSLDCLDTRNGHKTYGEGLLYTLLTALEGLA